MQHAGFPDSISTGEQVKILSIVDYLITGPDLGEQLDLLAIDRGAPKALWLCSGLEPISNGPAE